MLEQFTVIPLAGIGIAPPCIEVAIGINGGRKSKTVPIPDAERPFP